MIGRLAARLRRDRRGATAVEFALIVPVFLLVMMGAFDLAHQLYMRSVLQGSVQKSARDSALETGTDAQVQTRLDASVRAGIRNLSRNAGVDITRRFYRTFQDASVKTPEPFPGSNDTNKNGKCDNGEAFVDTNRNGTRDMDGGDGGQGAAKDRTIYTVTASFPRMFPVWRFIGGQNSFVVSATTVLANQPYSDQNSYGAPAVGYCK